MRTLILSLAAATLAIPAAPAMADPPRHAPAWGHRAKERHHHQRYRQQRRAVQVYDTRGRYIQPRRLSRRDQVWRARNGSYYCRRDNGTTGLVIGAGVGALAGRSIAGYGDRTLGTILGAVAGGLLGREIDRGQLRCR